MMFAKLWTKRDALEELRIVREAWTQGLVDNAGVAVRMFSVVAFLVKQLPDVEPVQKSQPAAPKPEIKGGLVEAVVKEAERRFAHLDALHRKPPCNRAGVPQ